MRCLDVETSGLDPAVDVITAAGVLDESRLSIFSAPAREFRESPLKAEGKLLTELGNSGFGFDDVLLTYNGVSFDIPFLKTRLMAHGLMNIPFLDTRKHVDLMHYAVHINGGTRIAKDAAAFKFTNLYVPRNSSGAYLAAIYRQKIVTDEEHIGMWFHLAQDLIVTQRLFNKWNTYPEFEDFYTTQYPDFRMWCPKWTSTLPERIGPDIFMPTESNKKMGDLFG